MADIILAIYKKGDGEIIDYTIDWSTVLGSDTISSSTWTVPSGITKDSDTETTTTATIWVSGGTIGTSYELENTIVTSGGRTYQGTIIVKVVDR